jgi:thiol-disulfide isomerase/thioredoxin
MRSRRWFLGVLGSAALGYPAKAFEFQPYASDPARKAIAAGKPVVVHVYAWWCLQCHAQASILDRLKGDASYDGVTFFKVDYDKQKDVVAELNCPRSTLIAFKGGKEVARMSWGTSEESVLNVLKAVM